MRRPDGIVPVINPLLLTGASVVESKGPHPRERTLPALPALSPTVGPLIKETYLDNIDRRTTAFLPALTPNALDDLTPTEMPDTTEHWVRVDLSEQIAVAYSGQTPIRGFVIASGLPKTPTVTGTFHIRAKVRTQLMEGGSAALGNDYYLPNVQWVQYFYKDYGFHGTYWHYAFGAPRQPRLHQHDQRRRQVALGLSEPSLGWQDCLADCAQGRRRARHCDGMTVVD